VAGGAERTVVAVAIARPTADGFVADLAAGLVQRLPYVIGGVGILISLALFGAMEAMARRRDGARATRGAFGCADQAGDRGSRAGGRGQSVNQRVAAAMLKRLGYRVDVVANGREAVRALDRCLAAGMDAYVTKPVTVDALGRVLSRLIVTTPARPSVEVLNPSTIDTLRDLDRECPTLLAELADAFICGAAEQIAVLHDAVSTSDFPAAARAAHQLRGSCGAVGATAMAALAAEIEA